MLATHLAAYPAAGDEQVFTGPRGGLVRRQDFNKLWAKARAAAGLPSWVTTHDLRHFFASLLIRAGLSVTVVSARLGHGNATETLGVYSHLWPDDEDRSRDAIESALGHGVVPHLRPGRGLINVFAARSPGPRPVTYLRL